MGMNKRYLPGVDELKKEYLRMGHHDFVGLYKKYEVFIGPEKSANFIITKIKQKIK